ncbi:hypothetical protein [Leptospira bouyouniensis]|uniref:Uncharacterized protein n=1 Tax=Leptospira bouyouniensis TaxID=2484911 RepID=A0ABY2L2Q5_9LEPT|nr:hypothetical protein [Leptospira bouyouniensis]TGK45549.1 hypothetical protein EHQ10_19060 [Leptospira bouyouniensis]
MSQATLTQKTEDQIDREVAEKTYTVISADIKSSLKLKAQVLQNYEITVDTGEKTNTNIWKIVESMKKLINEIQGWDLPTSKDLERDLNSHLANLALQFEATELSLRENRIKDRYSRLPSIEKIQINFIKQKDFKLAGRARPIFELQFQSNDPETLLPISHNMIITRVCLDEILQSVEPKEFKKLRSLCEKFFSEADLHLSNFNKEVEKKQKEIKESTRKANSQLSLSIVSKEDGDFEDEDE